MKNSDPLDLPYEEQIHYEIERVNVGGCCAQCLASAMAQPELRGAFQDEGEDGPLFSDFGGSVARIYAELFRKYEHPGAAWIHVLGSLCGLVGPGLPYGPDRKSKPASFAAVDQMIDTVLRHHPELDLAAGLAKFPTELREQVAPLFAHLLKRGNLDPTRAIDLATLREPARFGNISGTDIQNPGRLEFWLAAAHWGVLPKLLPIFREQSDDTLPLLTRGITVALLNYRELGHNHAGADDPEFMAWHDSYRVPPALAKEMAPYLDELLGRLDRMHGNELFVWMCWRLATLVHGENPNGLKPDIRKTLKRFAYDELGRLRVLTRRADSAEAIDMFSRRYVAFGYYDDLVTFVCTFGGIWDALKQLVLALRAFNTPCVASDLRYWNEPGLDHAPIWSWVPSVSAGVVHAYSAKDEERDPRLETLRRKFSAFCLERLKTAESGKPVEPSPVWRQGYIRAVRDLRVNPRGTGHRILHHARKNDPDPSVREAAEEAYRELRHGEDLPENRSPRRAILGALWWLRRAHFIDLCSEDALDPRGALRTRHREGRRTSDKEVKLKKV